MTTMDKKKNKAKEKPNPNKGKYDALKTANSIDDLKAWLRRWV